MQSRGLPCTVRSKQLLAAKAKPDGRRPSPRSRQNCLASRLLPPSLCSDDCKSHRLKTLTPEDLKKTDREKPPKLVFTAFRGFYLPYTLQCYAGRTTNHHSSGDYQVLRSLGHGADLCPGSRPDKGNSQQLAFSRSLGRPYRSRAWLPAVPALRSCGSLLAAGGGRVTKRRPVALGNARGRGRLERSNAIPTVI